MKQTVVIAGLGLIGGSIAKAIQLTGEYHTIGYDSKEHACTYAKQHRIVNEISGDLLEDAERADFIILATPISTTIDLMKQLNDVPFKKPVIISDVASVKGSIIQEAMQFTNDMITFIGGHPMAGSHKTGIEASREHLFENAMFVLIPTTDGASSKVDELKQLYANTKSRFITLQPEEHDEMTSVVSHFPHLIASSLVHQAKKWEDMHAFLPELAAGGFRDITRIASSNPTMWQDIFYHNRYKMIQLLDEWIVEMQGLKNILNYNNKRSMVDYLQQAKDYRDGLAPTKKGAIPSFYDIYVDIEDQPGAILAVVQLLATEDISITNIRILEIRDGITGALRISFARKETQLKSVKLLQSKGYEVMIEE